MSGLRLNSAYYAAPVDAFLRAADDEVYAALVSPMATQSPATSSPRGRSGYL